MLLWLGVLFPSLANRNLCNYIFVVQKLALWTNQSARKIPTFAFGKVVRDQSRQEWFISMDFQRFAYNSILEIEKKASELGVSLPFSDATEILKEPLCLNEMTIQNRLGTAPMEGSDANPDGSPSDLARGKYLRYAKGAWGLIWFEAVSVVQEGRASSRQLFINEGNLDACKQLVHDIKQTCLETNGFTHSVPILRI